MTRVSETIRKQVEARANGRCEYCYKPDIVSSYGYHVDHIIPISHGGSSDLDNLAWACFECNVSKGRDVASYDPLTRQLTPFFNPRSDKWDEHFEWNEALIVPKTPVGRVTVRLLLLNDLEQVEGRELLMEMGLW